MRKETTRIDYGRRIAKVAAHIDDNLDGDLRLETLAAIACFSPYHFHRIYRAITGETVTDTIRRQRLHRAAQELADATAAIERVARRAGYGSVEAFSRAFAAGYGKPPGVFRAHQLAPHAPENDMTRNVTIENFPALRVASVPHKGDYKTINVAFERLGAWAGPRGLAGPGTRMFGIFYDDPDSVPTSELRSDACLAIPEGTSVDGPATQKTIAPGRTACFVHKGPYTELAQAYRALYRDWLPNSGEEADDRPPFEEYLNTPLTAAPADLLTAIRIPLKG
jgi:AraC family transcriptional regulator